MHDYKRRWYRSVLAVAVMGPAPWDRRQPTSDVDISDDPASLEVSSVQLASACMAGAAKEEVAQSTLEVGGPNTDHGQRIRYRCRRQIDTLE
jgi:hypothetical protein